MIRGRFCSLLLVCLFAVLPGCSENSPEHEGRTESVGLHQGPVSERANSLDDAVPSIEEAAVHVANVDADPSSRPDTLLGEMVLGPGAVENPRAVKVRNGRLFVLENHPFPAFRVFIEGTWELEAQLGREGAGPGEFGAPPTQLLAAANGDMWIYDRINARLSRVYRAMGGEPETTASITLRFPTPLLDVAWLTDSTLVSVGLFRDQQFGLVDREGALLREFGGVPPGDENIWIQFRNQLNEGALTVHPSRPRFAVARRNSGRLEIFDLEGGLQVEAETPVDFESPFSIVDHGGGAGAVGWDARRRRGYVDIAATEDRIYALFSGRTIADYGQSYAYAQHVHEFDWEGRLHRTFFLQAHEEALRITVDERGSALYALHARMEPAITRFRIPNPAGTP